MGKWKERFRQRREGKYKRLHEKKILVLGGYGYNNVGDEAQLNAVIKRLEKCFPDCIVKVLSPNPVNTHLQHGHICVDYAPRVAFFKAGESKLYTVRDQSQCPTLEIRLGNILLKFLFLLKSFWIYINGMLEKVSLPTFLVSSQTAALLYDLHTSKLVYFSGGGAMTGLTLSRLWDNILICNLAKLYHVPVVISGQTYGVWRTRFNKWYTRRGINKVKLITLRDENKSINALKEIHISGEHISEVCDDALFCDKEEDLTVLKKIFNASQIDDNVMEKGYIVVNIQDWGMTSELEKKKNYEKLSRIIAYICAHSSKKAIFIPMAGVDVPVMEEFNALYPDCMLPIVRYDYDFKIMRGIIAHSSLCVTMKHHPIVFSLGENVPCISINYSDYYRHKNGGALEILGMKQYQIDLEKDNNLDLFITLFDKINRNSEEIQMQIQKVLDDKRRKLEIFEQSLMNI